MQVFEIWNFNSLAGLINFGIGKAPWPCNKLDRIWPSTIWLAQVIISITFVLFFLFPHFKGCPRPKITFSTSKNPGRGKYSIPFLSPYNLETWSLSWNYFRTGEPFEIGENMQTSYHGYMVTNYFLFNQMI